MKSPNRSAWRMPDARREVDNWTDAELVEYRPKDTWGRSNLDVAVEDEIRMRFASVIADVPKILRAVSNLLKGRAPSKESAA